MRRYWRRHVRPLWRAVRAPAILALALLALGLGIAGYMADDPAIEEDGLGFLDALYKALQLFAFGGGDIPAEAPTILNIARFLAPLLVGYAAIRGLIALGREQVQLLRMRMSPAGHVVIAGLGDVGFRIADTLNELGARVIVIEKDAANPLLPSCNERRIPAVVGDATDPDLLRRARVDRARFIVSTCGVDGVNIEVASAARAVVEKRTRGVLVAFAKIDDGPLWRALEARTLTEPARPSFRLELFNVIETAVRLLVATLPPVPDEESERAPRPGILVVADQAGGESLVVNLARWWRRRSGDREEKLEITIAGPDAEQAVSRIRARYPGLSNLCRLDAWTVELTSPALPRDPRLASAAVAYVALQDEARGAATAHLLAAADPAPSQVVLAIADSRRGAASVIGGQAGAIRVFGMLDSSLIPRLLFGGLNESLARAMHESYYQAERARGVTAADNESVVPWSELPESLQESNRRFADGIGGALRAVGCIAVPSPLIDTADQLTFSSAEVEDLARLEHDRWLRDHLRDGWTPGTNQDPVNRVHNFLIPWEELPEHEREKDRIAMRELPWMLAEAGFEVHRVAAYDPGSGLPAGAQR